MKLASRVLPLAALVFSACGGGGGAGSSASRLSKPFPVQLTPLSHTFQPQGLSSRVFQKDGRNYAPMDIQNQNVTLSFDAAAKSVSGSAQIVFKQNQVSYPVFFLEGTVTSALLNGDPVGTLRVAPPHGTKALLAIDRELPGGKAAVLELVYHPIAEQFSFEGGGVGFLTNMTDLEGHFFESWGPANYESDQFPMTLRLLISNATAAHQVFSNGLVSALSASEWLVNFPAHYTSSSMYVHLTSRPLSVNRFVVQGQDRPIPVTVYSREARLVAAATEALPGWFAEVEGDFGPYPHPEFLAYVTPGGGGMEYVGATISSMGALDHELFHSWFARGVMPAEGRSGWMDEGMASWRDYGYFRAGSLLQRSPTALATASPFEAATPRNCYRDGRHMLAELDLLLAEYGGMKAVMRAFMERYKYRVVTTEEFWSFVKELSATNVDPYFERYIFATAAAAPLTAALPDLGGNSHHPRPLTREEVRQLR